MTNKILYLKDFKNKRKFICPNSDLENYHTSVEECEECCEAQDVCKEYKKQLKR